MDGTHKCPAPECVKRVPFRFFACYAHWRALPRDLQNRIYAAWNVGDMDAHHAAREDAYDYWGLHA